MINSLGEKNESQTRSTCRLKDYLYRWLFLRKEQKSLTKLKSGNLKSMTFHYGINFILQFSLQIDVVHFSEQKIFWIIVILPILSEKWSISNFRFRVLGLIPVSSSQNSPFFKEQVSRPRSYRIQNIWILGECNFQAS